MSERMDFFTARGRWTHGSITEKRTKDMQGRPIDPEKQQFEWGVAVPKTEPSLGELFGRIAGHAKAGYSAHPHIVQRIDAWFQTMSGFSMKITDGDAPNAKGRVNEHTRGCYVFWFSTGLDVTVCGPDNIQIDPSAVQRGDFVDMAGNISINGLTDNNAGIYMNGSVMRLLDYGEPIVGSIDPNEAFGSAAGGALGARPGAAAQGAPGGGVHGGGVPGGGAQTGLPGGNPQQPAPDQTQTAAAVMPGQAATQSTAAAATASHGSNALPGGGPATGYPPHTGILPGQG